MSAADLIVRGGQVVTAAGTLQLDVAISDGTIVALEQELAGPASVELDARGLHVLPGTVDAHVHVNEPGRTDWEGFAHGTRAFAAGGTTTIADMPLNASPPTLDGASFDAKRRAAERSALVDFALWGGLVPGRLDALEELGARGVVGFKAFMSDSGIADFPRADDLTLYEGMRRAAALGALVAVHAESESLTRALARRAAARAGPAIRAFLDSRPAIAEVEAIGRALLLAEETGCALHVVHVSTGRGVALVAAARARGLDVSCETCPHYLVLDEEDLERLGALAKCAPPLRPAAECEALWRALEDGEIALVASDHSPAPPALKLEPDFAAAWGGIAGGQSLLPLLLDAGHHRRGLPLAQITELLAAAPARRLRLAGKGRLEAGADADLVLVDLHAEDVLAAADLLSRHPHSPYVGRRLRGRVVRTLVRGTTVLDGGRVASAPVGRLVRAAI